MKIINGFVTKDSFISNQGSQVAEFFELSPIALTYSKDHGEYQSVDYPGDILHTFITKETTTSESFILLSSDVEQVFSIVKEAYNYCTSHQLNFDSIEFIATILTVYTDEITNFQHGELYQGNLYNLPDWISWTDSDGKLYRIWFRSDAFENQYPFYSIKVVPPLDNLDNFFGRYADNQVALSNIRATQIMNKIQEAKGDYPDTVSHILEFKYYNPLNTSQYITAYWGIIVYGKNGDNIDSIKDTIIDFLLTNSTHTEEEWQVIFPEIFQRTEFVFLPRWDKIAIRNTNDLSSIFQSIYSPAEMLQYVQANYPVTLTDAYVNEKTRVMPFDYKAITCAVVSGATNPANIDTLEEIFPDYIPISTSDYDFNRMSVNTREWVIKMVELIRLAETVTSYSSIPGAFRKLIRNNKLYVSYLYNNINYIVAAKVNQVS